MARGRDTRAEYAARKARAAERGATVYGQRVERGTRRGQSRSQAVGHARDDEPSASELGGAPRTLPFLGEPGEVVSRPLTGAEARRASRANRLDRQLREGRISPSEFRARKRRM